MLKFENKIGVFGAGGLGKEAMCYIMDCLSGSKYKIEEIAVFIVDDKYFTEKTNFGIPVVPLSQFSFANYEILVAIGESSERKKIINSLPMDTKFLSLIHPKSIVSKYAELAEGVIIAPGAVISCDTKIGKHAVINYNATIGHDCVIGDFFTASPGANISGRCVIDECVYFGANATIRERIKIFKNVTIGMGAVVVKDIIEEGTYIGNPAKKLEKK
ncbi:MAG: acetyltransferase [Bacteroidales bacterium]|nr:acetyltransferase [Bacteroidales bacterium]